MCLARNCSVAGSLRVGVGHSGAYEVSPRETSEHGPGPETSEGWEVPAPSLPPEAPEAQPLDWEPGELRRILILCAVTLPVSYCLTLWCMENV